MTKRTQFKMSMRQMREASLEANTFCRQRMHEANWRVVGYWQWLSAQWDRLYLNIAGGLTDLQGARAMFAELTSRIDGVETDEDRIQFMEEMHDMSVVTLDFEKRKREKLERELQKKMKSKDDKTT